MKNRILVVDNDLQQMDPFVLGLKDAGFGVDTADNVERALAAIEEVRYDGVVLDVLMPRGSFPEGETRGGLQTGLALARRIRSHNPFIPVAFLTISRDPEIDAWTMRHPPTLYCLKTEVSHHELADRFGKLLDEGLSNGIARIERVLLRFDRIVAQLRKRHEGRPTLEVSDEYDVQDLLHSLLLIPFNDVRREEWTPSSVGAASRMDFLLSEPGLALETKVARGRHTDRLIGEELTIDVAKYRGHDGCSAIVCFVYDPDRVLKNPNGLERDLEELSLPDFRVAAVVSSAIHNGFTVAEGRP